MGKLLSLFRLKRKKTYYKTKTKPLENKQIIYLHRVGSHILYLALLKYILSWILSKFYKLFFPSGRH
jgi:hypothetical protein